MVVPEAAGSGGGAGARWGSLPALWDVTEGREGDSLAMR